MKDMVTSAVVDWNMQSGKIGASDYDSAHGCRNVCGGCPAVPVPWSDEAFGSLYVSGYIEPIDTSSL